MSAEDKRKAERVTAMITSYVRRNMPDGGYALMQFVSKDLSEGGIFIVTDDLTILDLSEDISLIVEKDKSRYFEGPARVVRSARIFESGGGITESGFGLMFLETDAHFREMIANEVAARASEAS
jgi:hypothetical protein